MHLAYSSNKFAQYNKQTILDNDENHRGISDVVMKLEQLIIDGKCTLVDDDGKPLKRVYYPGDHDSDDERDSYGNSDYDEDPYDDDMYDGQDLPDKLQDTCDSLDIRVRGRRKK
ncbi:hypothetical protein Tco_1040288 [Tanacetum coccineum]